MQVSTLLRWLSLIPFVIAVLFLVDFPVHWILYQTLSGGNDPFVTPYPELPERTIAPLVKAIVIVWGSAKIAPSHKRRTSFLMGILWLVCIVVIVFAYDAPLLRPLLTGIVGVFIGTYAVAKTIQE